jgi:arginine-tRNA-protein transferase
MILYSQPEFSQPAPCPYLPDRTLVYSFFFADSLSGAELSWFLSRGWRKFGHYFFRPACPGCRACTPLRVPVRRFKPSRGQKRVLRRCSRISVSFGPVRYEKELFDLYHTHSRIRFGQESTFDEFIANLHSASCPNLLARYEHEGRLLGAGYLDHGSDGLSSVYFVFDPAVSNLSPGIFSVLREIEETKQRGLAHYYLGYVVPGCERMAYKAGFNPHQLFCWEDGLWHEDGEKPTSPSPGILHPFSGWTGPD